MEPLNFGCVGLVATIVDALDTQIVPIGRVEFVQINLCVIEVIVLCKAEWNFGHSLSQVDVRLWSECQRCDFTFYVGVNHVVQLRGCKSITIDINCRHVEIEIPAVIAILQRSDCRVSRHCCLFNDLLQYCATIGIEIIIRVVNEEELILSGERTCLSIVVEHHVFVHQYIQVHVIGISIGAEVLTFSKRDGCSFECTLCPCLRNISAKTLYIYIIAIKTDLHRTTNICIVLIVAGREGIFLGGQSFGNSNW